MNWSILRRDYRAKVLNDSVCRDQQHAWQVCFVVCSAVWVCLQSSKRFPNRTLFAIDKTLCRWIRHEQGWGEVACNRSPALVQIMELKTALGEFATYLVKLHEENKLRSLTPRNISGFKNQHNAAFTCFQEYYDVDIKNTNTIDALLVLFKEFYGI